MISELLPETIRQAALFGELDRDRREQAWKVMNKLSATLGRDTIRIQGQGQGQRTVLSAKIVSTIVA